MIGSALLAVFLAACAGDEPPPPCPSLVRLADAQRLTRFDGSGRDLTDVLFEAGIRSAELACEYDDDVIDAAMMVQIGVAQGPAESEGRVRLAYFVAIVTRDDQVVAREEFPVEVEFEGNRRQMVALEEVYPRIPLKPGQTGGDYRIFVGLALTPVELEYNRANR